MYFFICAPLSSPNKGLENLQRAGVCHRDMSLENLLVHNDRLCLIIDLGMCLLIPHEKEISEGGASTLPALQTQTCPCGLNSASCGNCRQRGTYDMTDTFAEMSVGIGGTSLYDEPGVRKGVVERTTQHQQQVDELDYRKRRRYLIRPQGTCGKWHYMSPEIADNKASFDGHAVDLWASGVILFLMLTGFPPWERPCQSDDRFKYMTSGYLVQMLSEWNLGLSPDAMDLLQRMLWLDPKDRLGLEQVQAHPWMVYGARVLHR